LASGPDVPPGGRTAGIFLALILSLLSVRAGTLVQFRTTFGDIEVELYDQDKPVTVQNFTHYVQSGRYLNEISHRLVQGFVLQGGGFTLTTNIVSAIPTYPPITNEFGVGRQFSNVYGTIAMAKLGGYTNSATSQWFFNLASNTFLDAPNTNNFFVVFGHVIKGTNVLNIFNNFQNYNGSQTSNIVADIDKSQRVEIGSGAPIVFSCLKRCCTSDVILDEVERSRSI